MKGLGIAAAALALAGLSTTASAHPAPFSYVDVRIEAGVVDLTIVAHVFDVGHELGIAQSESLLEADALRSQASRLEALIDARMAITANGRLLAEGHWDPPEPLPDRQSVRLHRRLTMTEPSGSLLVSASLFPYDSQHQTFVNFYERDRVQSQVILDQARTRFEYIERGPRGIWTTAQRFVVDGVRHIVLGPEHLVFLLGLLLLGGTLRQLVVLAGAFTAAQIVTLTLAAFGLLNPQPRLVEPAIALSIVYVGVDNLLVRDGRDMRAWIALAFGLIHGFAFAGVLRTLSLQTQALGWSVVSFSIGVLVGQVIVSGVVATLLAALRSRSEWAGRRFALAGSLVVVAAGTFWFVQRVFFSGGIS